jgi:flavin-dependent dehydrogenase
MLYDLIIIGGGPAGSSAAITAARAGARVLLLERGKFPRQKVCGEFTSAESLGLLGNLLTDPDHALFKHAPRISRARVFLDDRVMETPINPAAASIARYELDAALWDSAQKFGVDARSEVTVQAIDGYGPFLIQTNAGAFDSRALINATGRWSNLTSDPTFRTPSPKWIGLKAHFHAGHETPLDSTDLYFFDGGYCGVQAVCVTNDVSARINACAMVRADVASTIFEVFEQHPWLQERAASWQLCSDPVATSPLIFRKPTPVRHNTLMVGDAAGFVDPFVGDGISLALRSGALAAESLKPFLSGEQDLATAVANYRAEYNRTLAPIFRASSALRRMLRLPSTVRRPLISLVNANPRIARFLVVATR